MPNHQKSATGFARILDAIESGEIVIKQAADEIIQEYQGRMVESGGHQEQSATG